MNGNNLQTVNVNKQWVLHNCHREFMLKKYDHSFVVTPVMKGVLSIIFVAI